VPKFDLVVQAERFYGRKEHGANPSQRRFLLNPSKDIEISPARIKRPGLGSVYNVQLREISNSLKRPSGMFGA
jgi:hypothetical protein